MENRVEKEIHYEIGMHFWNWTEKVTMNEMKENEIKIDKVKNIVDVEIQLQIVN